MAASLISSASSISSISSSSSFSSNSLFFTNSSTYLKPQISFSFSTLTLSLNSPLSPLPSLSPKKFHLKLFCTVQELQLEETQEEITDEEKKKKLYVVNLPYTVSVPDIKSMFGECGTVRDVEIIKQKDGRNKGYAFVTMDSGDECRAVIEKFDSHELSGRIIRVEFAKRFKKPTPPRALPVETRHKLYVSNLAWKARSSHLRELFSSTGFNPVSARVVFDSPTGRSAGYGFVSFTTREEAEAAMAALNGKELLERPMQVKFSENNADESGSEPEEESSSKDDSEDADTITKPEES